jgi:hypothetical protein
MRRPWACAWLNLNSPRLLFGCALGGFGAGEDRVIGAGAREQDGEANGGEHEEDGRPGGELGEKIGCSARSEGGLRSLATEGSSEVGGLALLEQDDADEEERDENVQDNEKNDHRDCLNLLGPESFRPSGECLDWCGGGDLNPYALRR